MSQFLGRRVTTHRHAAFELVTSGIEAAIPQALKDLFLNFSFTAHGSHNYEVSTIMDAFIHEDT